MSSTTQSSSVGDISPPSILLSYERSTENNYYTSLETENVTDEMTEEALNFSSQRIIPVIERSADNTYVYDDQTALDAQWNAKKFPGSKTSSDPDKDAGEVPSDQVVTASIIVSSVSGGSTLVYYEDKNTSSYSLYQGDSPQDPVDQLAAGQKTLDELTNKSSAKNTSSE